VILVSDAFFGAFGGRSRVGLLLAVAVLVGAWVRGVQAEEVDGTAETRTVARELARQGADAYDRKDYAQSLDLFDRAAALVDAPTLTIMQARSLVGLGRLVEALDRYAQTERAALAPDSPEAFRQAVDDAKKEGEQLRTRIPRLTIHVVANKSLLEDVAVTLDGKPVPSVLLDVERPVDPGRHEVVASAPHQARVRSDVIAAEGEARTVELVLKARQPELEPSASPVAPPPAPRETSSPNISRSWGWVGLGVGGGGLLASGITGWLALDKKSKLDDLCKPGCPPGSQHDIDSFRALRTWSYLTGALGVLGVASGGYVLFYQSDGQTRIGAHLGPGRASLQGTFQ